MSLKYKRVILPMVLVALVFSTLLYGYHGDYSTPFGRPPSSPAEGPYRPVKGGKPASNSPNTRPMGTDSGPGVWTPQDIANLAKQPSPSTFDKTGGISPNTGESFENRLRYEQSDTWRSSDTLVQQELGILDLPRLKVPQRSSFANDGEYLRQSLIGDFKYGADKVFYMLKTGADTQWKRMPMHFMTDLTHVQNFALYSDAPGSVFGHEIIDIIREIPQEIIDSQEELERYRAHMQSHNEHWNWAPEELKAEGGWLVDRYKNIPMLYDAYKKNPNCDWYIWADDDSYVFYDTLLKWLDTMNPSDLIYTGATAGLRFDGEYIRFAHGGSVVAVSNAVVEALFGPEQERRHTHTDRELLDKWAHVGTQICCGDALFALMILKEIQVPLYEHPDINELLWFGGAFQGENLANVLVTPNRMCGPVATWHHLSPHDMEVLYTYERLWKEDRAILYNDIYRDFFLPYIVEERPNWWIAETGRVRRYPKDDEDVQVGIEAPDGRTLHPALEKNDCREACAQDGACAAWSWKPEMCVLQTTGIPFGSAANTWNKQTGCYSGWMVDRIRQWRAASECDPLELIDGVYNDNGETSEGWMIRKLEKEGLMKGSITKDTTIPQESPAS